MKFPGYEISDNCNNLIITNKDQAFTYAFNAGINSSPDQIFWYLFNGCLKIEPLTPYIAYYFFDLLLWAYCGFLYEGKITYDELDKFLRPFAELCGSVNPEIKMITVKQVELIIAKETKDYLQES